MSHPLPPAVADTPLGRYYAATKPREGERETRDLGVLDALTIRRYALTVGARDPIHHDAGAARAAGYADVVAPPNLLAAIFEWGAGTPEDELAPDGTPRAAADDPGAGLRGMGAGEEMELLAPVVAGTRVLCDEILDAVVYKDTRGGPCVFVTALHVFRTPDGTVLNRNRRTVVRRNPHEEP
ncbi:FAS1-like dehydratase domain-containing protein [Actinomadura atramentaria]|uniref:FAS1-like dehydratase domain-containing protein n=1 Tax=Actinomadura atramentaria TaxID=1990 RepID=UPI0003661140|nr:MaoC family dehydratase N-terminal domain-containing protein [Actinomadura atramentaria]